MVSLNINQITIAWLNSINGISNSKIEKIIEYFGGVEELWHNFHKEKNNLAILKTEHINELSRTKDYFEHFLLNKLEKEQANIVTKFDDEYPKKLRNIEGAPYILYYKGDITCTESLSIAVVGSRKATSYGIWVAEKFTKELSELGVTIISGLAAGIDTVAHRTAIKANTNTIGVIGSGINIVYPRKNEELYKKIIEGHGTILSEFHFGIKPLPGNFPVRNRIISGLSDGVLIIEAQEKSGTLITAGHAANQGKDIFAVPGNINSLYSKGTNSLIRDGAKITTCLDDIVEEILQMKELYNNKNEKKYIDFNPTELEIINFLNSGDKSLFEISENINININELLSILTALEMKGIISQMPGKRFILS